jgi:hypothetical protein
MSLLPLQTFCVANTSERCGYGTCLPDASACICDAGYTYDFTWIMCPNCYLPTSARIPLLCMIGILSVMVGLFGMYQSQTLKGIPRKLCIASSIVSFLNATMMGAEIIEGRPGRLTMLFEISFLAICANYLLPLLLFSILSPVLEMTGKRQELKQIKRILYASAASCILVLSICWVLFCIYVDDYRVWNMMFQVSSIYLCTHDVCLVLFIRYWFIHLLYQLDSIRTVSGRSLEKYKNTLKRAVRMIHFSVPMICLTLYAFSILYFTYGCFPYMYVFFVIMHLTPNIFCLTFVAFAKLRRDQLSESNSRDEAHLSHTPQPTINEGGSTKVMSSAM